MSPEEAAALKRVLNAEGEDGAPIDDPVVAEKLASLGYVRPAPNGWLVTVPGHLAWLDVLRTSFDLPEPIRGR